MTQFVDLVVDGEILFDISIRAGNVRFRLIVVVIGNEKLHAVLGEKLPELVAQLRGERLVVRDHERGAAAVFDDVRHREGLAAPRHAQKHLRAQSVPNSLGELFDRLRLIAGRLKFGM